MLRRIVATLAIVAVAAVAVSAQSAKPPKKSRAEAAAVTSQPLTISGMASSGRNCVAGTVVNVHPIGWAPRGSRVTVTFSSDFDPIASLSMVALGAAAADGESDFDDWIDDDSGGNFEPLIRATTDFDSMLVLYVKGYGTTESGCYFFKTEVQTP